MATNVTVYDLVNYPDNGKTVTVDQKTVVPVGYEGDEQWVLSFVTTAYSNNTARTVIQDVYVQETRTGWAKSSGLVNGPFVIASGCRTLGVKMDASSQFHYVQPDDGIYGGNSLATNLEAKIRALATTSGALTALDDELAYKNAEVDFIDNKFYIISGNMAESYTGAYRSSVKVTSSGVDTLYEIMGFNLGTDSESIAGTVIREALVSQNYTAGGEFLYVSTATGLSVGQCLAITDNTNIDYFPILAISGTKLTVPITATNGFDGISHSYTANEAKVQTMALQDSNQAPVTYRNNIDSIIRWGIMGIANQIDFSS